MGLNIIYSGGYKYLIPWPLCLFSADMFDLHKYVEQCSGQVLNPCNCLGVHLSTRSLFQSPSPSHSAACGCSCYPLQVTPCGRHSGTPAEWHYYSYPWHSCYGQLAPHNAPVPLAFKICEYKSKRSNVCSSIGCERHEDVCVFTISATDSTTLAEINANHKSIDNRVIEWNQI